MQQKLCLCGCGQPTTIATSTNKTRGSVKGQPVDWIKGHIHRVKAQAKNDDWYRAKLLTMYKVSDSGCWEWIGHRVGQAREYGGIKYGRKDFRVHRLAYLLWVGPIPEDINVLHKCDNPTCFNPEHLFLGTQLDNVEDMTRKGRRAIQLRCEEPGSRGHYIKGKVDLPAM